MTYTSDQQLAALGLRPLRDIPNREGFKLIARTRDGRDVNCTVGADRSRCHFLVIDDPHTVFGNLVGWRPA